MRNIDVINAMDGLRELSRLQLPIAASIRVRKLVKNVGAAIEDIEAERVKLLEQHAERDKDGGLVYLDAQRTQVKAGPEFSRQYQELMNLECVYNGWEPLRVSNLGDIKVTPLTLMQLGDLLTDE